MNSLSLKKTSKILLIITILSLATITYASALETTYGTAADENANKIFETGDGGYVVIGSKNTATANGREVWAFRVDSDGNGVWGNVYGTEDNEGYLISVAACETSDNGYAIATNSHDGTSSDIFFIKIDICRSCCQC